MIGTAAAIALGLTWYFLTPKDFTLNTYVSLIIAFVGFGTLFLKRDKHSAIKPWGYVYTLLSLALALYLLATHSYAHFLIPLWILATGAALDLLKEQRFPTTKEIRSSIEKKDTTKYQKEIDSLSEGVLHGLEKGRVVQANEALSIMGSDLFGENPYPLDFYVSYLVEHLEMLFTKSLDEQYDFFANKAISTLVKLSLRLLPSNGPLAIFCLKSAKDLALLAEDSEQKKISEKAICTFQEAARFYMGERAAPTEVGNYLSSLIASVHQILKASYKNNKEQSIKQLILPLAYIKEALDKEPYLSHPQLPAAKMELDNALETFKTLEVILHTMPSNLPKEEV